MVNILSGISESIIGETGVGKSRYVLSERVYNPSVNEKKRVLVIVIDETIKEVEDILVSKHIYMKYDRVITTREISSKNLSNNDIELIKEARYDLFNNTDYGEITITDGSINMSNYLDVLEENVNYGLYNTIVMDDFSTVFESEKYKMEFNDRFMGILSSAENKAISILIVGNRHSTMCVLETILQQTKKEKSEESMRLTQHKNKEEFSTELYANHSKVIYEYKQ